MEDDPLRPKRGRPRRIVNLKRISLWETVYEHWRCVKERFGLTSRTESQFAEILLCWVEQHSECSVIKEDISELNTENDTERNDSLDEEDFLGREVSCKKMKLSSPSLDFTNIAERNEQFQNLESSEDLIIDVVGDSPPCTVIPKAKFVIPSVSIITPPNQPTHSEMKRIDQVVNRLLGRLTNKEISTSTKEQSCTTENNEEDTDSSSETEETKQEIKQEIIQETKPSYCTRSTQTKAVYVCSPSKAFHNTGSRGTQTYAQVVLIQGSKVAQHVQAAVNASLEVPQSQNSQEALYTNMVQNVINMSANNLPVTPKELPIVEAQDYGLISKKESNKIKRAANKANNGSSSANHLTPVCYADLKSANTVTSVQSNQQSNQSQLITQEALTLPKKGKCGDNSSSLPSPQMCSNKDMANTISPNNPSAFGVTQNSIPPSLQTKVSEFVVDGQHDKTSLLNTPLTCAGSPVYHAKTVHHPSNGAAPQVSTVNALPVNPVVCTQTELPANSSQLHSLESATARFHTSILKTIPNNTEATLPNREHNTSAGSLCKHGLLLSEEYHTDTSLSITGTSSNPEIQASIEVPEKEETPKEKIRRLWRDKLKDVTCMEGFEMEMKFIESSKVIVSVDRLVELRGKKCLSDGCPCEIVLETIIKGASVDLYWQCSNKHFGKWTSSQRYGRFGGEIGALNFQLGVAAILTGSSLNKTQLMMKMLGVQFIGDNTYARIMGYTADIIDRFLLELEVSLSDISSKDVQCYNSEELSDGEDNPICFIEARQPGRNKKREAKTKIYKRAPNNERITLNKIQKKLAIIDENMQKFRNQAIKQDGVPVFRKKNKGKGKILQQKVLEPKSYQYLNTLTARIFRARYDDCPLSVKNREKVAAPKSKLSS